MIMSDTALTTRHVKTHLFQAVADATTK